MTSAPRDQKISFLSGKIIDLRPLIEADADGDYPTWLNDAEVCAGNSHHVWPYGREQAARFIAEARSSRSELVLAIEDKATKRHVGNIALQSIHPVNRSAELSFLIGDRASWGKGIGLEAGRLMLAHAFDALGLHRVACGTFEDNAAMKKLALALGMRQEGVRRGAVWKRGRFLDVIEYGILAEEFRAGGKP